MSARPASLLVDVSNSRTKFTLLLPDGSFSPVRILPTEAVAAPAVAELLHGWEYAHATVASVVPAASARLAHALSRPVRFVSAADAPGMDIEYMPPEALGADRLACAVALAHGGMLPAIAVDAGTAVTFDLVTPGPQRPAYRGGAIAPGLQTMAHALSSRTALLPEVSALQDAPPVGRNTVECLQSGLLHGFRSMVRGLLSKIAEKLENPPHIVLSGGDAPLLAGKTGFVDIVDNMLVFKGLAIIDKSTL